MKVIVNKLPLKHVKGDINEIVPMFSRIVYALAILSVIFNTAQDLAFGIKALLIFGISILTARETEIFFLSHKANIHRPEAKEALKTTRPELTAIIYALLLPVGTPLFVVAVGAFIAIFVGKMIFGGYSFNVFNPAIVGRLFVGISWPALTTINFPPIMDNYLLQLLFKREFSGPYLSSLQQMEANGIVSLENIDNLIDLLFTPGYGMLFTLPAIIYVLLIVHFYISKIVDLKPLLLTLISSIVVLTVITIGFDLGVSYILYNILAGGLLFVCMIMMTDPFTKPFNTLGTIYYTAIFSIVFSLIRFLGKDADGVLYALLFTNLFVPLLNKKTKGLKFGLNKKSIIAVVVMLLLLVGTGLFINAILGQRILSGEIMVGAYVKS